MEMKKVVIGAIIGVVSMVSWKAVAYSRLSKEQKVQPITLQMTKRLSLTDEQRLKVHEINMERMNGHEQAFNAGRDKAILRRTVKTWEDNLKLILNDRQVKKLKL